ncbi:hypothetical protein Glove_62g17 [Diversispora epigaea]|uniref:Uncharacterized protein n=1 Tax=Diversispora epigaea TaxID=1348612 RepID=A0A397JFX8_9GLOM|nr:hypothetical protein Glove_62g17 [Diversispora epigaea]
MSAIATKIVEKYNLTPKMSLSELMSRIAIISPSKNLEEEIIREIAKRILQNKYGFSGDQVNVLFSSQKNKQYESTHCETASGKILNIAISNQLSKRLEEETIREMAQRILRDKLSIRDIKIEAYALALSAPDANVGSSRLYLHEKLFWGPEIANFGEKNRYSFS